jgi:DNA-binding response OmpR family regulator
MKLLIVEDEDSMLNALVEKFSSEGFETVAAKDGKTGFDKALVEKPDLILLDIVLPEKDGMTMMRELRAYNSWGKGVPIILLTNLNADDKIMEGVAKDEPSYYLVKTDWTLDQIVDKVKERLEITGN